MRSVSNRTSPSPTRTNYNTTERSRTAEDRPQGAPPTPAIANDQNAPENLLATRADQTEAQGGSLAQDRETSQPASSVPAMATHRTDALPAGQGLPLDRDQLNQLLADRRADPSILSDPANSIPPFQGAPRTGQTEAPREDTTLTQSYFQLLLERQQRDLLARWSQPATPIAAALDQGPLGYTAARDADLYNARSQSQVAAQQRGHSPFVRPHVESSRFLDDDFLEGLSGVPSDVGISAGRSEPTQNELNQFWHAQVHSRDLQRHRLPLAGHHFRQSEAVQLSGALGLEADLFRQFDKTHDLALLAKLVTKSLRGTDNPNLKTMLRRLVEDMAAKPPLAERVFVRLLGADESCGDRVSLGLSWAQEEWLAQPVWDGSLNHDLPKVIDIARQVFRRRFIEELAQQKVEDINKERRAANLPKHTEDVATLLALLAGLHGPLELGGEKPDAEFISFRISGVKPEDIEKAKRDVLALEGEQEGKRLWEFLATWTPWQEAVLGHLYPDEVAEIKRVLSDPDRWARLERQAATEIEKANVTIESVPIEFRQGHITRRANRLDHEEALQLWLPLTRKAWSDRED